MKTVVGTVEVTNRKKTNNLFENSLNGIYSFSHKFITKLSKFSFFPTYSIL